MNNVMKKSFFILLLSVIMIAAFCSCGENEKSDTAEESSNEIVTTFEGENITREEVDYFSTELRSEVINYYSSEYGVTDFGDFWDKKFGDETPREYLEKLATEKAIKSKAELLFMKEYEIYDDISYEGLKTLAEKYNEEHKDAKGTVGITSIDLSTFYTYYISTGRLELINRMSDENPPSQEEIENYRNENKLDDDITDNYIINKLTEENYEKLLEERLNK